MPKTGCLDISIRGYSGAPHTLLFNFFSTGVSCDYVSWKSDPFVMFILDRLLYRASLYTEC